MTRNNLKLNLVRLLALCDKSLSFYTSSNLDIRKVMVKKSLMKSVSRSYTFKCSTVKVRTSTSFYL